MSYELLLRSCAHKKTFAKKEEEGSSKGRLSAPLSCPLLSYRGNINRIRGPDELLLAALSADYRNLFP
jgi:hypothetical protein